MESHQPESIVEKRLQKNRIEYLVKWNGYGDSDNTWEARVDLIKEGHKQYIEAYEKTGPPTAKELRSKVKSEPAARGRTTTPRRNRRARSKTPVRRRSSRKTKAPVRFIPELDPRVSQATAKASDDSDGDDDEDEDEDGEAEAEATPTAPASSEEAAASGAEAEAADAPVAAAAPSTTRVMFSDVATLGHLWTGFLVLMAVSAATLHLVLQHMLANEDLISRKETTLRESNPQLVVVLLLVTRVLPTALAFWTVRSAGNDAKNYTRSAYITFLDIALIWCVATDVIEQLVVNVEPADVGSSQLVILCSSILVQLALVVAFSTEHRDAGKLPALRPELMVAAMAGAIGLLVSISGTGEGQSITQCKPEVVAIVVAAASAVWRAAARVGYGHDNSFGYGTLSQWLGLLGVTALAVSAGLRLCAFGEFGPMEGGMSPSMIETARLANYWIALATLTGSAVSP